jgi:hypothetical protein
MRIRSVFAALMLVCIPLLSQTARQPETWLPLSIAQMRFEPAQPLLGGKAVHPDYTREVVRVEWRKGDPIDLYIVRPVNVAKPPVILFLYSWPADTDRFGSEAWCRAVTQHGFAAVGFVSALTGERYRSRPWKEWFVSELPEAVGKSVHDVQLLLNYLDARGDMDMSRAGMFGQGSGGTVALLAASVDPRLKAVDVIDPWGDWPDWYAGSPIIPDSLRTSYTDAEFQKQLIPFDPVYTLPKLASGTVRVQQTMLNPTTPSAAKERIQQALPAGMSYVFYASEEDYRSHSMERNKILDWLESHLSGPAPVQGGSGVNEAAARNAGQN